MSVKIYKNTTKKDIYVVALDETIPAGEQVSVVTDYQPPVNLQNYPGLIDATDGEPEAPASDETKAEEPAK